MGLPAEASRRDVVAVSTDDPAGYRIKDTSSGTERSDDESAGDMPEFLITQKAGADPAKHAVCFLQIRHVTLLSDLLAGHYRSGKKDRIDEKPSERISLPIREYIEPIDQSKSSRVPAWCPILSD